MSIRGKHAKRVVAPLTDGRRLTLAVWGITAALWLIGGFNAANRDTYDVMTALLPAPPASDDVVVVAIDAPSFAEIGLPWPWPRRLHARLVEAAHDAGAAVVAFDIVFDTPTPADGNFAEAIGHHGAVVLAAERAVTETPHATIETQSLPVAELVAAGARAGFAEMPLDPDGRARRLPAGADSFPRQVLAATDTATPRGPAQGFIRYRAGRMAFTRVSYYQALEPETYLPPGALDGKILLVGLALQANPAVGSVLGDFLETPRRGWAAEFVPGVEVLAHSLATLRAGDARRSAPWWAEGIFLALAAAGGITLLFVARRKVWWRVGAPAAGAAGLLLAQFGGLAATGLFVPLMAPVAALTAMSLTEGGSLLIATRRERKKLIAGFGKYVAPDILREILARPSLPALGGEWRPISVIATDLAGFTSLLETTSPEEQAGLLRGYLDALGQVIMRHGGMVDQFIGDAIIALFNAPVPKEGYRDRAAACAVALDEAAEAYRARMISDGVPFGVTRIGLHAGEGLVGNFGTADRFHYTAMGDVTNAAARLELSSKALGTRVLASREALSGEALAAWRPAARLSVPGKDVLVEAYAPVSGLTVEEANLYREGYAALSEDADLARRCFVRLARQVPNDPLVALYAGRLRDGVTGDIVTVTKG